MSEQTFVTFDPLSGAPANNQIITRVESIVSFRINPNTNDYWVTLVSGDEYKITQADWETFKAAVDAG